MPFSVYAGGGDPNPFVTTNFRLGGVAGEEIVADESSTSKRGGGSPLPTTSWDGVCESAEKDCAKEDCESCLVLPPLLEPFLVGVVLCDDENDELDGVDRSGGSGGGLGCCEEPDSDLGSELLRGTGRICRD